MTTRYKWDVAEKTEDELWEPELEFEPLIAQIIKGRALTAHFQPIFSSRDGRVYGCEALARVEPKFAPQGIGPLFNAARKQGMVAPLDRLCRQAALECAMRGQMMTRMA